MKHLLPYITEKIERAKVRHEIHHFPSGAIMIDIWISDRWHVIQIDGDTIGLSQVKEDTMPFDIIPDQSFKNADAFKAAFEEIFAPGKKTIIIKGDRFSSLEGFYDEVERVLTKNIDWTTGRNLDAFNDLLRGGFGVHAYEEPVLLIWESSDKSRKALSMRNGGQTIYAILTDIIRSHRHIEFIES